MKRMRSWWLAAAACAVLAAALLLPQRFLQQKLDRVAETEFSVDGAEPDMEEVVTLMERLRLAAVGEFIALDGVRRGLPFQKKLNVRNG